MADFCTLADVKAWLGITDTNSDSLLTAMISQISAEIRTFTNRDIYPVGTYTETLSGNGRQSIVMPQYPITAVSSLTVDGVAIPARQGATGSGYVFDDAGIYLDGYTFARGVKNVSVTYSAGFATLPPDLQRACIEWVAFRQSEQAHIGLRSKSIGNESASFATASDAAPPAVMRTLNQWTRYFQGSP